MIIKNHISFLPLVLLLTLISPQHLSVRCVQSLVVGLVEKYKLTRTYVATVMPPQMAGLSKK